MISNRSNIENKDLPAGFDAFHAARVITYTMAGQPSFDIRGGFKAAITTGKTDQVTVAIEANAKDLPSVQLRQNDNTIKISRESPDNCGPVILHDNDRNITVGPGSVVIGGDNNGSITFNQGSAQVSCPSTPIRLIIIMPAGSDLKAYVSGTTTMASVTHFNHSQLTLEDESEADISSDSLKATVNGSSHLIDNSANGSLDVRALGDSSIEASGKFSQVHVDASGMSTVTTWGTDTGEFLAYASGMGHIIQTGTVFGPTRVRRSGRSQVDIR